MVLIDVIFIPVSYTHLGLFFSFQISNVSAEETGPLVVQGIVQEGYKLEVVVLVVKADTEEVVKTLKINPETVSYTHLDVYKRQVYSI